MLPLAHILLVSGVELELKSGIEWYRVVYTRPALQTTVKRRRNRPEKTLSVALDRSVR